VSTDLRPATGSRRLLLTGLCLLLGGALWFETNGSAEEVKGTATVPPPKAAPAAPAGDAPFAMPPLADFAEFIARPLFNESRRPAAVPTAALAVPSSSFILIGIVLSSSGQHALIERGQPPKLERVTEGQEIDGWQVEAIRPDRVIIQRGTTREELKPKDRPPKATTAPARPAATPSPGQKSGG
jgi:hypothetical protein